MMPAARFGTQTALSSALLLALMLASCSPRRQVRGGAAPPKPGPSGPGLIICDPMVDGADAAMAGFGDGCARWLHFAVAGQGALDKTPSWNARAAIPYLLGRKDTRLSVVEAAGLSRHLGVTHVAIGRISGSAKRCALTYQLYEIPAQKPIGQPKTLSGSDADVLRGLPALARELSARLGLAAPRVPAQILESASDLGAVGRLESDGRLSESQSRERAAVGKRSRVALLLLMMDRARSGDDEGELAAAGELLRRAPENALALNAIGRASRDVWIPTPDGWVPAVQALRRQYPNNYLLWYAEVYAALSRGDFPAARQAAQECARCSPDNPACWETYGDVVSRQAESIRHGRFIHQMTDAERSAIAPLYTEEVTLRQRATRLDPTLPNYWIQLSSAAAFAGNDELAESSLQKAIGLHRSTAYAYAWGLDLYSPRWLDDEAKREKIAQLAARERYGSPHERLHVGEALYQADWPDLALKVLLSPEERERLRDFIAAQDLPPLTAAPGR